jgi:hypothetical protein
MSKRAVRFLRGGRRSGISKPPSETPPAAEETRAEETSSRASDPAVDPRDRETFPEGVLRRAYVPPRPPSIESLESEKVPGAFDDTPEPDAAASVESGSTSTLSTPALDADPPARLTPEPAVAGESDSRPTQPEPAVVKALVAAAELALRDAKPEPPEDAPPEPPASDAAVSELAASRPDHRLVEQVTLEPQDEPAALEPATLEPQAEPATLDSQAEPAALEPEAEPDEVEAKADLAALEPTTRSAGLRPPVTPAVIDDAEPPSPSRNHPPGEKSLSPTTNDADPDSEDVGPAQEEISPEALAVRARMRRIVGAGLALLAAGVAAGAIIVAASKSRATGENASANRTTSTAGAPAENRSLPPLPPLEPSTDKGPGTASTASPSGEPSAPPAGEGANTARARELNAQALDLLKRRKSAEAVPIARAAIEADPDDALPYLYLGSALQDMGRWKDAMAAYDSCVKRATRGMIDECRAMGGQKK